jgi:hypothetical protein
MNDAEIAWLMAPGSADEDLSLEDFQRRPEWMAQDACNEYPTAMLFPAR